MRTFRPVIVWRLYIRPAALVILAAAIVAGIGPLKTGAGAQALPPWPGATAELKDGKGKVVGHATFTQNLPGGGIWIHVEVAGLDPGVHAIHIHENGVCEGPAFLSAGGHFNPEGRQHGLANLAGPHAGDLPNMTVGADGKAKYDTANYRVTLGAEPNSLLKPGGTSLVIHAGPDDNMSNPAGNSGARIACGVITLFRP